MKPVLAIVGRPNVGKSTLFNRLIGRKRAITHDEAGVTRDRHYGDADWEGRKFTCIDTGGIPDEESSLATKVRQQIQIAIQEADVILFLLDGKGGLLPEEQTIADLLRKTKTPVFYAVNKIDSPQHEERLADFYELGAEKIYPLSAEHSYRVNDLLDDVVKQFPAPMSYTEPPSETVRVAMMGRPNVGKSSLFNRLIGEDRAVVHDEPGTTRDTINTIIKVKNQSYTFLDTAGIRRKSQKGDMVEHFSIFQTLRAVENADIALLLLDASTGLLKQDAHLCGYICENYRGLILVWNKWDLATDTMENYVERTLKAMPFANFAPMIFLSAKTGWGAEDVWKVLPMINQQMCAHVTTSKVNEAIEAIVAQKDPPSYRSKPVRFYYGTQTSHNPPMFTIFANAPKGVATSYRRFMVKQFRELLNLCDIPIRLRFQPRRKPA